MEGNNTKILLNKERSVESVNENAKIEFTIDNTNKLIPLNNINVTVSAYQQFLKEREESKIYRFYGVINAVVANPLYNDNIEILSGGTTHKIKSNEIFENNGWVGFFSEPTEELQQFNDNESDLCNFVPFAPGYDRLNVLDHDGVPNYKILITYPAYSSDTIQLVNDTTNNTTLKNGVPIIQKLTININGRNYVGFKTLINHGLKEMDSIRLYNFIDNTGNDLGLNAINPDATPRLFNVYKLGDQTNDNKFRVFVLDINPLSISFTFGSTIKRVVNGKESSYYVRNFKAITATYNDYDIYPASYGVNYFDDKMAAFNYITDVDVSGLKDNLGRPLSEVYLTIVKNDNDGADNGDSVYWAGKQSTAGLTANFWGTQWGGYSTELPTGAEIINSVVENPIREFDINYNVRAIGDFNYDTLTNPNSWFYGLNINGQPKPKVGPGIDESDTDFHGDIVEYNSYEMLERTLENVYYRINTVFRENYKAIYEADPNYTLSTQSYENKYEGYMYRPFKKIIIREFSSILSPIVNLQTVFDKYNITSTLDQASVKKSYRIPDYATQISPNVYRWRPLLEVGEIDAMGSGVEYPFESGAHYIYLNTNFYLERQDPPCEFIFTSEDLLIPSCSYDYELQTNVEWTQGVTTCTTVPNLESDKDVFREMITRPTFFDYTITVGNVGSFPNFNGSILDYNDGAKPLPIDVRFAQFSGDYELGPRDTPGACVDFRLLETKDIDNVC